ncbi:MAG: hypothetical protein M3Z64_10050 [Verrucomicrobiota bacterium]|nr:hypothetical protein [Verrucomicrobiota bacterium]
MIRGLLIVAFTIGCSSLAMAAGVCSIVDASTGYLLGASNGRAWLDPVKAARERPRAQKYRLYCLLGDRAQTVTGTAPTSPGPPCPESFEVRISPKSADNCIALAAPWNAMPRKVRTLEPSQPAYVNAVRRFLDDHDLHGSEVKITQVLRCDLDADGEPEVVISATNFPTHKPMSPNASAGSYSVVLLRHLVRGKVETTLIDGELYPAAKKFSAPNRYRVAGLLDLDGDGKYEIVLHSEYYEGEATVVYRLDGTSRREVLRSGCGA